MGGLTMVGAVVVVVLATDVVVVVATVVVDVVVATCGRIPIEAGWWADAGTARLISAAIVAMNAARFTRARLSIAWGSDAIDAPPPKQGPDD